MLSSEVDELVELMDRVFVFWENSLVEVISRANLTRANLVSSFFGEPASDMTEKVQEIAAAGACRPEAAGTGSWAGSRAPGELVGSRPCCS